MWRMRRGDCSSTMLETWTADVGVKNDRLQNLAVDGRSGPDVSRVAVLGLANLACAYAALLAAAPNGVVRVRMRLNFKRCFFRVFA